MKQGIHPKWNKANVIVDGKIVLTTGSTLEEIKTEIWSGNHPFYTGQETLVDVDNLVEKFNKKMEAAKSSKIKIISKKEKRQKRREKASTASNPITLKDMLKSI